MNVLPQISTAQATQEVPQTVVSNISELPSPIQNTPLDTITDLNDIIFQETFSVQAADSILKKLMSVETDKLFVGKGVVIPQSYILNQAIRATYNVEFTFEYSKLPGCVFALEWRLQYKNNRYKPNTNNYNNIDNGIIYVDSQSTDVIKVSLPWNGQSEHCLHPEYNWARYNDASVKLEVFLYERYKPTVLQPTVIDVLVYSRFVDVQLIGRHMNGSNTFFPLRNE